MAPLRPLTSATLHARARRSGDTTRNEGFVVDGWATRCDALAARALDAGSSQPYPFRQLLDVYSLPYVISHPKECDP